MAQLACYISGISGFWVLTQNSHNTWTIMELIECQAKLMGCVLCLSALLVTAHRLSRVWRGRNLDKRISILCTLHKNGIIFHIMPRHTPPLTHSSYHIPATNHHRDQTTIKPWCPVVGGSSTEKFLRMMFTLITWWKSRRNFHGSPYLTTSNQTWIKCLQVKR